MSERRRVERETDDEITAHLQHRIDELTARGVPRKQAEEEALRRFGPLDSGRAEMLAAARHRDRVLTMFDHIDSLRHDAAFACRQLRRAPGLAATIVVTFALGVGANATMFGLLDRLLLRAPAHIASPGEIVRVQWKVRRPKQEEYTSSSFSYPAYAAVRDNVKSFVSTAMTTYPNPLSFGTGGSAHPVQHVLVSGNYFATLGTRMVLGRPILESDDVLPSGSPVVVIAYQMWQTEFGGDPQVLGRSVDLAGHRYTIIGVAPTDFLGTGTKAIDVWIPVSAADGLRFAGADWATLRTSSWMTVFARLKPGVSPATAGEEVAATLRAFRESEKGVRDSTTFAVAQPSILPRQQPKLSADSRVAILLGGVSVLVLLIACANVANLLLARGLQRRREIAVRLALGISRQRLIRQLVIEGLTLAAIGGAAALIVVQAGGTLVYRVLLTESARPSSFIDMRLLIFTLGATLGVGIITSLIPAVQASTPNLSRDLKDGTRGAGTSRSRTRLTLLLVQAALSVVLLAGTGAFVASLRKVNNVGLGVNIDRLVLGLIDLKSVGMDSAQSRVYFDNAAAAVRRLPGVERATIAEGAPFSDWSFGIGLKIPGRDSAPSFDEGPYRHGVTEEYFRTVGTRILRGRGFHGEDFGVGAEPVIVINEDGARRLFPGEEALGKCISIVLKPPTACARIVGIAEDTHRNSVVEKGTRMQLYNPLESLVLADPRALALIVRATSDPGAIVEAVRHTMQTVSAGLPFANVKPMAAMLDRELRPWRLGATLFGIFGAIALVLSALGLYSVVSYSVAQRTHEMGVRIALGARVLDIARLVLSQGLGAAAVGIVIGLALTLAGAPFVQPLLYEMSARDPLILASVACILLAVATAASLVPARRATRADPMSALRAE